MQNIFLVLLEFKSSVVKQTYFNIFHNQAESIFFNVLDSSLSKRIVKDSVIY